jgi:hypothetical protein
MARRGPNTTFPYEALHMHMREQAETWQAQRQAADMQGL